MGWAGQNSLTHVTRETSRPRSIAYFSFPNFIGGRGKCEFRPLPWLRRSVALPETVTKAIGGARLHRANAAIGRARLRRANAAPSLSNANRLRAKPNRGDRRED